MKALMTTAVVLTAVLAMFFIALVSADELETLRNGQPIDQESSPQAIPKVVDADIKSRRNYPMQPPLIPHDIRGYDVNLQVNKCMSCHSRKRTEESQAPMISVTHYMNREGNFLANVSPRRYFCNQCHVTQTEAKSVVENDFKDMDEIMDAHANSEKED